MRLIDADYLLALSKFNNLDTCTIAGDGMTIGSIAKRLVEMCPTIDAEPVRHGRRLRIRLKTCRSGSALRTGGYAVDTHGKDQGSDDG